MMEDLTGSKVHQLFASLNEDDQDWITELMTFAHNLFASGMPDATVASMVQTYHERGYEYRPGKQISRPSAIQTLPEMNGDGYVYLVRSISGHYKIGRTKDIDNRIATFHVKLPFEVELLHVIPCADYRSTERFLHDYYADRRVNGEWFALTDEDVEQIKAIDAM